MDGGIFIALPQYPTLTLLDVAWPPRGVEMVKRNEPFLHIGPGAHLFRRAQQDSDAAGIDGVEKSFLLQVRIRVMDISDFLRRDAPVDKLLSDFVIDIEAVGIGR